MLPLMSVLAGASSLINPALLAPSGTGQIMHVSATIAVITLTIDQTTSLHIIVIAKMVTEAIHT
jgi:hypothetical protein